ncbi:hypothetical protein MANES_01G078950v8 [Manihot esculenta]|uniref:Uncharacterized protein n=1 Tax=Manihot esculenta TaxID=3983 RepID=A0ACB7IBG2_MANES|nr:hypothetical protein MANES_01G078950v8 [Manihot esculenta]
METMVWFGGIHRSESFFGEAVPRTGDPKLSGQDLFIEGRRTWDDGKVCSLFGERDRRAILSISLGRSNVDDRLIWIKEKRYLYTVNSAYYVCLEFPGKGKRFLMGQWVNWSCIWRSHNYI